MRAIRKKYDALLEEATRTPMDTLELVECGLLLVESAVFSAKLVPKLRGFLKPLMVDVEGPYYTRAQAVMSAINELR